MRKTCNIKKFPNYVSDEFENNQDEYNLCTKKIENLRQNKISHSKAFQHFSDLDS